LIKLVSTVDWLVVNSQNIAKLFPSPLQPGFNSLAEAYNIMYILLRV